MTYSPDVPDNDRPVGLELADHPLTAQRLEKVSRLRAEGIDPYPLGYKRDMSASALHERFSALEPDTRTEEVCQVAGRLMNVRRLGRLLFGVLQDHSGRIQLFVDRHGLGKEGLAAFGDLDQGDWIWAKGEVMTTRRGELSIHILSLIHI